ncbi:MAG: hypothetical protein OJF59_002347 [Cytophagales bacterium]|jgi:hypothetical protein|nr:phytanoyl-CoA dioxygenase family protein [Bacteroidota bacterium]MBS1981472.1 phytanoyl-CoA dioxygenase family protein [Bacteroidota bacterium]WHZ08593.1 MAG: hypothetical protein OJF59_002347 [Cytophagales bacterium]
MEYQLNNQSISYLPEGKKISGSNTILLHHSIDLTANVPWHDAGYAIEQLYHKNQFTDFFNETKNLLIDLWRTAGLVMPGDFALDQYHTLIGNQRQHLSALEQTKLIFTNKFPLGIHTLENRISEICGIQVVAKNPFDHQSVFHFRVIRPNSNDNNPLHRDTWLEEYAGCINLYIPIAGSNAHSSLSLIPGSHLWPENKVERTEHGAQINEIKFNVPAVSKIKGKYELVRPDPKENEVLVFSPYLIHGGAVNLNKNQTRISIELRLWKKH